MKTKGFSGLFLVGVAAILIFFIARTNSPKHQPEQPDKKQTPKAQDLVKINTSQVKKEVSPNRSPALASDLALNNLRNALGNDEIGRTALIAIQRSLARHQKNTRSKPDRQAECMTEANCPVPLNEFYKESLSRLSTNEFAKMKGLLVANMLASDMGRIEKATLIAKEFTSEEYRQIPATSAMGEDGQAKISADVAYMVLMQNHLARLGAGPKTGIGASLTAISNSQDPVGRLMASVNLLRLYPQHSVMITAELNKLGVTNAQINRAIAGRKSK